MIFAAVSRALSALGELDPERVIVFRVVGLGVFPLVLGTLALDIDAIGIALEEPTRSLDEVNAAVRSRQVGVVADVDRPAHEVEDGEPHDDHR